MHGPTDTETCARCFREPGQRAAGGPPLCGRCAPIVASEQAAVEASRARIRQARAGTGKAKEQPSGDTISCGLKPDEVWAMHAEQDGKCAICERAIRPFRGATGAQVDHCHRTGVIRGLLCGTCNVRLARIDDNLELVERMAAYLRRGRELSRKKNARRWRSDR